MRNYKSPHQTADQTRVKRDGNNYVIPPKALNITWGSDRRYWSIPENGPAGLIQVCWLEVSGSISPEEVRKKYQIRFEVQLKPDSFGWNGSPVLIMAKVGKRGSYKYEEVPLNQTGKLMTIPPKDTGLEIEVPHDEDDRTLYFGLYEVWSGKWKGGLEIMRATVQPVN